LLKNDFEKLKGYQLPERESKKDMKLKKNINYLLQIELCPEKVPE